MKSMSSGPEGDFLFTCEHCRRRFLSEYSLIAHKRDEHSVNDLWSCRHCGKQFRNAKFCKNHEKKHETGEISEENQFVCHHAIDDGNGERVGNVNSPQLHQMKLTTKCK